MKITSYNLAAGAFTPIPALQFARLVNLQEEGTAPVGLVLKFPSDNFTTSHSYQVGEAVTLGNATATGHGTGPILGWPAQSGINARVADIYVQASCAAGATVLRVTEVD